MQKIRAAVIGVGYLGRFHAQKYAQAAGCELVAVVDSRPEAREQLAAELKTRAVSDYRTLLGNVEAVSVATPTPAHFAIARDFLEAGAHVLVEKPITDTPAQARELIALAARVKRSEEHTSELQSQSNIVCRLLLEKKNMPGAPTSAPWWSAAV